MAVFTNATPLNILDNNTVTSTIVVSGVDPFLVDINVQTFLAHTFPGDLDVTLTAPDGRVIKLTTDNGGTNDNVFNGTVWDDSANPGGQVPYVSNNGVVTDQIFQNGVLASPMVPEGSLAALLGADSNGTWTLTITDDDPGEVGLLSSWSLDITALPGLPFTGGFKGGINSTPLVLPDVAVSTSTIVLSGLGTKLLDVELQTFIRHTFPSDLDITLTSPAGTVVTITTDNGGTNDDVFNGTSWETSPTAQTVVDATFVNGVTSSPLNAEESLGAFNGENPNGTWTLTISDDLNGDTGTLDSWTLAILSYAFAPTNIALSNTSVAENSTNGTIVGALSATDPDPGDTAAFSLTDNAGGRFAISGSNLVVANGGLLNFESSTSHSVTVRVTDKDGVTFDKIFAIGITNANEAPTNIALSNASVAEQSANGTLVGALSRTDPDAGDTATFSLTDNAGGRFGISGGNLVVANGGLLDFESSTSHSVTVRVTDGGGLTFDKVFNIGVTDINENAATHWTASVVIPAHPPGSVPRGIGDFNGDGTDDIAWYNASTNSIDIWKLSNGQWSGSVSPGPHPAGYQPVSFADFNQDGVGDVLWFNSATGQVDLWKIVNGQWAGSVDLGAHPAGSTPALSGDFNGDGTPDVAWHNPTTNRIDVWKIVNGQWAGSTDVGPHPAGSQPVLAGDFNGDGTSDIAWFNPTTGNVDIWKMVNGTWAGSVATGPHPTGWQPLGAADFNRDGTDDIAWYNPTTNRIDIWKIQNGQWAGSTDVGPHPAGWVPVGVGDFDHNGVGDISWQNTTTGAIDNWLLDFS